MGEGGEGRNGEAPAATGLEFGSVDGTGRDRTGARGVKLGIPRISRERRATTPQQQGGVPRRGEWHGLGDLGLGAGGRRPHRTRLATGGGGATLYIVKAAGPSPATPPPHGQVLLKSSSSTTNHYHRSALPCTRARSGGVRLSFIHRIERLRQMSTCIHPAKRRPGKWVGPRRLAPGRLKAVTCKIHSHARLEELGRPWRGSCRRWRWCERRETDLLPGSMFP